MSPSPARARGLDGRPAVAGLGFAGGPSRRLARTLLAAGALLALGVLAALGVTSPTAHAAYPGQNGRIACGSERGPAPAPGQPRVGGIANSTQTTEILTLNPDGSEAGLLTNNAYDDFDPVYSPDGRKVAFESFASGGSAIYTMNSDGTGVRRLTFAVGEHRPGGWSPDGSRIVFAANRDAPATDIYTMNAADGSDVRRLTTDPATDSIPSWSPDGSRIAFQSPRQPHPGNPEVYTMNPDGTDVRRLTFNAGIAGVSGTSFDGAPVYSPDGRRIAFHSTREGPTNDFKIYTMNAADGGDVRRVTSNPGTPGTASASGDLFPAWSPDGRKIAFGGNRNDSAPTNDQRFEVYTVNVDGSDLRRLTTSPGFDGRCDWQPLPRVAALDPSACPTPRIGTEAADTLNGTPGGDRIFGLGGRDIINGVQGADCLFGGEGHDSVAGSTGKDTLQGDAGNDTLKGGSSADRLSGGSGRDRVLGDAGNDRLFGGSGNDSLSGGRGRNGYSGGSGNDRINAANGKAERVNCGSGRRDSVRADGSDRLRGCERRRVVG